MRSSSSLLAAFVILTCAPLHAATQVWPAGGSGNLYDSTKFASGIAPVNGDIVTSDGTGSVIGYDSSSPVTSLATLGLNVTSGATVFNHTSGTLALGTLNFGGGGASRNPTYNMNGGQLDISSQFTWGNGSNARFIQTAGIVNYGGGSLNIGVAGGARGYITMTGGTFNANSVAQLNLANTGSGNGQAYVNLSGSAVFNATSAIFVIGQYGATTGTSAFAELTIADTSELNTSTVVLGGNNASAAVFGVINLNGGTITAGSIRKGSSSIAASSTANVLRANGGTVKVLAHANNTNYFLGTYLDVQAGGLKLDTNGNETAISGVLSGVGGLTKTGEGNLTLSAVNTYTGDTTLNAGSLTVANTCFDDASTISVASGAKLRFSHSGQDQVGKIVLNGTEFTAVGTYGSSSSGAIYQDDNFFEGTGVLRIGPASLGRSLVWTGANSSYWEANGSLFGEYNFLDGATPAEFIYNDSVTFDDTGSVTSVLLNGLIYPDEVVFNGTRDYLIQSLASPSGLGGGASVTTNNTATVSLGGADSSFTGPIHVNSGVLKPLNNKSFGASSGITIASGARVDLNGKAPGSIYTYTLNGNGPDGGSAIINSGADVFSATGIRNLVLNADSVIGNDGGRFDIGHQGTITGNGHTLTKIGNNPMAVRGDASGSVIRYVIQGGHAWAESTANAFGGSGGSVLVKSGAAVGHFGAAMTIATPVTIESGGTLRSGTFGAATALTGTWSGNITLAGNVTLDAIGGPIALTGPISGTANLIKTGVNSATLVTPTYGGNTTVNAGTLVLQSADLGDGSTVSIANGAKLKLDHGSSDTVDKLVIAGAQVAAGTWGASGSGATHQDDAHFEGLGTLNVLSDPPASGFSSWIGGFSLTGNDALANADPDGDGSGNAVEYVIGGNPSASSREGVPSVLTEGDQLVFTFRRSDNSETPDVSVSVEYGNDLIGWTSVPIGAAGSGIVTVVENGGDPDLITVSVPKDGDSAKFARLKVTVAAN